MEGMWPLRCTSPAFPGCGEDFQLELSKLVLRRSIVNYIKIDVMCCLVSKVNEI